MNYTGKIIVLAFPDTFVKMSTEFICKILPLVGLGTREYIKAGHAALVLIENETGEACYFDFGRYVTPPGNGRVRGANTDAELKIPFKAKIDINNQLKNIEEFLIWLDANPQKTHGSGRLLASVCDAVNFKKAQEYINQLQGRGSMVYAAFDKTGSNCSRFVTDTILASTDDLKLIKSLNFNKKFTPSTVGNVEKAAIENSVFQVFNGVVSPFKSSALKENLTNYFDKRVPENVSHVSEKDLKEFEEKGFSKLEGTGSVAWFEVVKEKMPKNHFRIRRYSQQLEVDYDGVYVSSSFDSSKPFKFTYDSHCAYCHVVQNGKKIKLKNKQSFASFNSSQKQHSA
ncbi:hypothetical protein ULMS_25760 [Patiriisocius marinistellae]|uniref:Uncharacterized protein n=1 Tax=Patiriisocius marinistellae TaxID=2494560 RepID=A0A5J4G074_9FLAO|nr:DUF6695 family protein [Patiriisocius marinistellae]GEQ87068.1 hypothetical protein ULMS_25760 [Patiriisocius marinistellae]